MRKGIHCWLNKICAQMLTLLGFGAVTTLNSCIYPVLYGPPPEDYDLSVSPTHLNFPRRGGSATIQIQTNDSWSMSKKDDFVMLSATAGQSFSYVYVSVLENNESQTRSTYLIIRGDKGGAKQAVEILQDGSYSNDR